MCLALGAADRGFRLEFKVARSFFGAIRTRGDALIDHKDVLLIQEIRETKMPLPQQMLLPQRMLLVLAAVLANSRLLHQRP